MSAIRSHSTGTTDAPWDAGAMVKNMKSDQDASYYKSMFAWQDPEGDPSAKSSYKFPHHMVSSDGTVGAANTRAASAGIGALNGGRGGADIPDGDRKGVYNHLARHIDDAGKDIPDLQSSDDTREWKSFPLLGFKAATDGDNAGTFAGYASTWTKDAYGDVIQPGAFAQSIAGNKGKIPIFFNHDPGNWIGFSTALAEDHRGLLIQASLALDTQGGADAFALLKAADAVDFRVGLSIGFISDDWEMDEDNGTRIIKSIDLWETSITPFPANKRAFIDQVKTVQVRDFEKRLRDVRGFSAAEAKAIVRLLSPLSPGGPGVQPPTPAREVRAQGSPLAIPPKADITEKIWQTLQRR